MYFGSTSERAFERKNEGAITASSVLLPPPLPESGENGSKLPASKQIQPINSDVEGPLSQIPTGRNGSRLCENAIEFPCIARLGACFARC